MMRDMSRVLARPRVAFASFIGFCRDYVEWTKIRRSPGRARIVIEDDALTLYPDDLESQERYKTSRILPGPELRRPKGPASTPFS